MFPYDKLKFASCSRTTNFSLSYDFSVNKLKFVLMFPYNKLQFVL
jgi:hypothetical protein